MKDRIDRYERKIGQTPPLWDGGKIYGIFMLGNDYSGSGYYGSYPGNYMERMLALFPETPRLHLFSGEVTDPEAFCVDFDPETPADLNMEIEKYLTQEEPNTFETIFADPPYSKDEAENYNAPYPNKRNCMKGCGKVLRPGGYLIWLDQRRPIWAKKDGFEWAGCIGVDCGSNRIARFATILRGV